MRKAAEALAFGPHAIRKHFADEDPDDRALRKGKKGDVADQHPYEQIFVPARKKDGGDSRKAEGRADGTDEQELLTSHLVDDRHGNHGENKIRGANGHRLQVTGNFAESCLIENFVQIIKNGVDAGELVEHADSPCEKYGVAVFGRKESVARDML